MEDCKLLLRQIYTRKEHIRKLRIWNPFFSQKSLGITQEHEYPVLKMALYCPIALSCSVALCSFFFPLLFFFLTSLLEYNCFTMVC